MQRPALHSTGAHQGSFKSYTIGFICSIILTALAYGLVLSGMLSHFATIVGIVVLAVAQILVHLHYFLHLDGSSAARWNLLAMIFTVLIMLLFVGGTLWVMYHLKFRLM